MTQLTQRSGYAIHEFCEIYPWMPDEQIESLAESIKQIGLIYEITLFEGKILDGKCRYEACRRADVVPRFREFKGTRLEALQYTWSMNACRKSYSEDQRRIAVRYEDFASNLQQKGPHPVD